MKITIESEQALRVFGERLGELLAGGEIIELVGDVGAGKTTLVKAIASGMGIKNVVSSPSYTLSQTYESPNGLALVHYDFYRLDDPGILASELAETLAGAQTVAAIEWAAIVTDILPADHLRIEIIPVTETSRELTLSGGGPKSQHLVEELA